MGPPQERAPQVTLLDASCLIALAEDEPVAAEVEALLRHESTVITSVNLLEVADYLTRRAGWPEDEVRSRLALVVGHVVRVEPVGEEEAWRGARIRVRYYEPKICELSLADCVLLASCRADDAVATSDPAVVAVARAEGIDVIPLPDSSGRRP